MLILLIGMVLTAVDQVLKYLVRQHIRPGETIPVIDGFVNISHVCNTGAAWGLLAGFQSWLIGLSIAMLITLVVFRRHFLTDTLCHRVATGLMCAGIIGNLIDRLRLGHVVDFVDLHWRGAHFPSFNVADSAICVGVGLYMLTQVFPARSSEAPASPATPAAPPAPPAGDAPARTETPA